MPFSMLLQMATHDLHTQPLIDKIITMDILTDLIADNLDVVFCGTAAGNNSARKKIYYAGPGNLFYQTLHEVGLTTHRLQPLEFEKLLDFKIGLTDLAKKTYGNDSDLTDKDYDVDSFIQKIHKYKPKLICFNGKEAARAFYGLKSTKIISYGPQKDMIGQTRIYVAPSTSAQGKKHWNLEFWNALKCHLL